jgi:hypothetical protein
VKKGPHTLLISSSTKGITVLAFPVSISANVPVFIQSYANYRNYANMTAQNLFATVMIITNQGWEF